MSFDNARWLRQKLLEWLDISSIRAQRRFLETHIDLVTLESERILEGAILEQADTPEIVAALRSHIRILSDAGKRDSTPQAVREAYVNEEAGLVLDLPPWLERIEQHMRQISSCGQDEHSNSTLISLFQQAITRADSDTSIAPEIHASLWYRLAVYLREVRVERAQALQMAIPLLEASLQVYTLARYPAQHAKIQHELGLALFQYTTAEWADYVERAINCLEYEAALHTFTQHHLLSWAGRVRIGLGNIYTIRIAGEHRLNLERAIEHCTAALQIFTASTLASERAMAHMNLANAYRVRIEGERRSNLEEAIAPYTAALTVYTADALPEDWATLQQNIGSVYLDRSVVEKSSNIEQVIQSYHTALQVRTQDALPEKWADTQCLLGDAYLKRIAGDKRANQEQGIPCSNSTLEMYTQQSFPTQWARIQITLGSCYAERLAEERRANQEQAIKYIEASLQIFTHEAQPDDWALAQMQLGTIYIERVTGEQLANIEKALQYSEGALHLPNLATGQISDLFYTYLDGDPLYVAGGLASAQIGSSGRPIPAEVLHMTWREAATLFQMITAQEGNTDRLAEAMQGVFNLEDFKPFLEQPMNAVAAENLSLLFRTVERLCLQLELQRCFGRVASSMRCTITVWLQERSVTGLTLIPSGPLALFPLTAVYVDGERTVADIFPMSVAPYARSLLQMRQNTHQSQRSSVYAIDNPLPTYQRLEWGEAEALAVARIARAVNLHAEVRVQEKATRQWLIDRLSHASIIEASCHGKFAEDDFLRSAIIVANREQLTLADMLHGQAELRGLRLFVLSVCQTSIPDLQGALDEMQSLAVGVLQAGACAILASLWPVDDRATYLLIARVFQEWLPHREQESPAAALARARDWLRTVTNHELTHWQVDTFPATQQNLSVITDAQVTVRGESVRYDIEFAGDMLTRSAQLHNNPDERPYAPSTGWVFRSRGGKERKI